MTQSKHTKRALLSSVLAMLVCVAMLIGSTFAWFTDSVTSGNNKIVAGNLDVELYYGNLTETEKVDGATKLFTQEDGTAIEWEPGVIAYENFKVVNKGSLALKYQLKMNVLGYNTVDDSKSLMDVLKVAILDGKTFSGNRADAQKLNFNCTLSEFVKNGTLLSEESDTYAVIIYWEPGANDNDYNLNNGKKSSDGNPLYIDLGVTLVATQDTVEKDSFDEYYDKNAGYPSLPAIIDTTDTFDVTSEGYTLTTDGVTVTVPAGAVAESTTATFSMKLEESTADSVTYDINLTDGDENPLELNGNVTVSVNIGVNLTNVQVYHSGTLMDSGDYSYDPLTGILTISTSSFSLFKITYQGNAAAVPVSEYNDIYGNLKDGDIYVVSEDVVPEVTAKTSAFYINKCNTTLTLAGATINAPANKTGSAYSKADIAAVSVSGSSTVLNINGSGTVNGGSGAKTNNAVKVRNGATVNIYGGTYTTGADVNNNSSAVILAYKGTVNIYDGFFYTDVAYNGSYWVLNCQDNTDSHINVYGGTFVNFDPSNNVSEGEGTNFVAQGYKVVSEQQSNGDVWYTVVPG